MHLTMFNLVEVGMILLLLGAAVALGMAASGGQRSREIDPRALLALDEAGAYLRSLAGFDVSIETEVEQTTGTAPKHLDIHSRYKIKWPDLMYAELSAEGRTLKFYFYGGEFTVFSPNLDKYTKIKLPPLLRQAMDFIYWRSGFRVPLARLIYFDSKTQPQRDLTSARRIGSASLEGTSCEVYAFRQAGLELKVWIRHAPEPLPVRLEIRDPQWHHGSRHVSRLDWKAYAR
jgi:hypothetical protein